MESTRRIFVCFSLITYIIVSTLTSCLIFEPTIFDTSNPRNPESIIQLAYNESSPFSINGNNDFAIQAGANGWIGNGSTINPYIIKNLNISSTSGSLILASVSDTDVYFRIESNFFSGGSAAIQLDNTTNGIIFNNSIQDCSVRGAVISKSNQIQFVNNTIKEINENGVGLYCYSSNFCYISNNTIMNAGQRGILMDYSTNCSILINSLFGHSVSGMKLRDSDGNSIHGNRIHHNNYSGIALGNANNCNITDNVIFCNEELAIDTQGSSHTLIQHNLIYDHLMYGVSDMGHSSIIQNNTFFNNSVWALRLFSYGANVLYNNFIDNGKATIGDGDAEDHSDDNYYDYNYWSEWTFPDVDGDMVVDNPRYISNTIENYDHHPVTIPYVDMRMHIISDPDILIPYEEMSILYTGCNVTWIPSGDTFGHTIHYSLYYSENDTNWVEIASEISVNYYHWNLTSYPDGTNVTLRVVAICSSGHSSDRYSISYLVREHKVVVTGFISPRVGDIFFIEITVGWNSEGCSIGHLVLYTLYYSIDNGINWITIEEDIDGTSLMWSQITTLMPGTNYMLKLVAECTEGIVVEIKMDGTFTIIGWPSLLVLSTTIVMFVVALRFIKKHKTSS